jgi:hypothetical protein
MHHEPEVLVGEAVDESPPSECRGTGHRHGVGVDALHEAPRPAARAEAREPLDGVGLAAHPHRLVVVGGAHVERAGLSPRCELDLADAAILPVAAVHRAQHEMDARGSRSQPADRERAGEGRVIRRAPPDRPDPVTKLARRATAGDQEVAVACPRERGRGHHRERGGVLERVVLRAVHRQTDGRRADLPARVGCLEGEQVHYRVDRAVGLVRRRRPHRDRERGSRHHGAARRAAHQGLTEAHRRRRMPSSVARSHRCSYFPVAAGSARRGLHPTL